jgi:hypothetical protein
MPERKKYPVDTRDNAVVMGANLFSLHESQISLARMREQDAFLSMYGCRGAGGDRRGTRQSGKRTGI